MSGAGKDCTSLFQKYHRWVNGGMMLERCQARAAPGRRVVAPTPWPLSAGKWYAPSDPSSPHDAQVGVLEEEVETLAEDVEELARSFRRPPRVRRRKHS